MSASTGVDIDAFTEKFIDQVRNIGGVAYRMDGAITVRWHAHLYHLDVRDRGDGVLTVDVERS